MVKHLSIIGNASHFCLQNHTKILENIKETKIHLKHKN